MIDYSKYINDDIASVKPSGIRKFFDIASNIEDVISLSIGEPDFSTPWHIRQVGIDSLEKGRTWYSPNKGFTELLDELCKYYKRRFNVDYDPKTEAIITVGGSEAIDLCLRTLINKGDDVLIPQPSFVCYEPLTIMAGGTPVAVETTEEDAFKLTPEKLESAITPNSKLLILPYPNNPTGAIMTREDLEKIVPIIIKHDLIVLSDEIYGELTYNDEGHVSLASLNGMKERTVTISGFSKAYAMTGWRLGYALGPSEIISVMTKLHQFAIMSSPSVSQYAAIEALKNGDTDIAHMRDEYDQRRRYIVSAFRKMGLDCFEPEGAFYIFPSIKSTGLTSDEFCERLIKEKHVAVIPGTAFGECGEGFIRVSYSYSIKHIKETVKRIQEFLQELK